MKRLSLLIFLTGLCAFISAQKKVDMGVTAGASYYLGDINPERHFYAPSPAFGLLYRYNFNPRQNIRATVLYMGVKANDADFSNDYQRVRNESFNGNIVDVSIQFEFNFLPYSTLDDPWTLSPYVAGGLGLSVYLTDDYSYGPSIPFGAGMKVNLKDGMAIAGEWSFIKTFADYWDGVTEPASPGYDSLIHNNDWYSYLGITFTWKIFDELMDCPTYWDVENRRY